MKISEYVKNKTKIDQLQALSTTLDLIDNAETMIFKVNEDATYIRELSKLGINLMEIIESRKELENLESIACHLFIQSAHDYILNFTEKLENPEFIFAKAREEFLN